MKTLAVMMVVFGLAAAGCRANQAAAKENAADPPPPGPQAAGEQEADVQVVAKAFLREYQRQYAELELKANTASWAAANSGKKEDFDALARASLALKKFHSSRNGYRKIRALLKEKDRLAPLDVRALEVAELAFKGNQLPGEMLEKMVNLSTDIEQTFNTFRAEIHGKRVSNNDLLEMIRKETDSEKRKAIWQALKQVGGAVGPKLVTLARLRNEAAAKLGYRNYWEMGITTRRGCWPSSPSWSG